MADTQTREPGERRRWPTVLLAVSLAANVLVLGMVAGAHFRDRADFRRFPPPSRTMVSDAGLRPFMDAMPRDVRNRMVAAMRRQADDFAPDRDALAAELRDMLAVLRADPYDSAALETLLTAQHDRVEARIRAGRELLAGQIEAMSAPERRAFADQLEDRFAKALAQHPGPPPGMAPPPGMMPPRAGN